YALAYIDAIPCSKTIQFTHSINCIAAAYYSIARVSSANYLLTLHIAVQRSFSFSSLCSSQGIRFPVAARLLGASFRPAARRNYSGVTQAVQGQNQKFLNYFFTTFGVRKNDFVTLWLRVAFQ
ncbi:MAG TPA: hypothetical protein VF681_03520, partial [Abditibacteriaceae bacterium]